MNKDFFDAAFDEAQKAYDINEVPIGAVIVKDGKIVSKAHNLKEKMNCCIFHAELIAIKEASKKLNNWRLEGCELYVTLDPCPMCASAIKQARIQSVFSALNNSDNNNLKIIKEIFQSDSVNPGLEFQTNLDCEHSKLLLNSFFEKQRKL